MGLKFRSEHDNSVTYQTFSLDCNGAEGNMIYITDTVLEHGRVGHGISEVYVQEKGELHCNTDEVWLI
jgi:hypothetical protein